MQDGGDGNNEDSCAILVVSRSSMKVKPVIVLILSMIL
jgi:hypothetical protein